MSFHCFGVTLVAEPLVRQLVRDGALARRARVDRPGLVLQRVAGVTVVVDDGAERGERVRPKSLRRSRSSPAAGQAGVGAGLLSGVRSSSTALMIGRPDAVATSSACSSPVAAIDR
jgi:hypothetical protein